MTDEHQVKLRSIAFLDTDREESRLIADVTSRAPEALAACLIPRHRSTPAADTLDVFDVVSRESRERSAKLSLVLVESDIESAMDHRQRGLEK